MWSSGARALFEGIRDRVSVVCNLRTLSSVKTSKGSDHLNFATKGECTSWEQWHFGIHIILQDMKFRSSISPYCTQMSHLPLYWYLDWKAMPGTKELGHMISSKPAGGHLDHWNRPMLHQFRRLDPNENASDNTASPNRAELSCDDQSVRYTLLKMIETLSLTNYVFMP